MPEPTVRSLGAECRQVAGRLRNIIWPNPTRRYLRRFLLRDRLVLRWMRLRYEREYRDPAERPLVTVVIPTWNRSQLLVERSVASVLRQTYSNFEVLVVGDHCTDDTAARLQQLADERIRFVNLARRGPYPEDPKLRWCVAGTVPTNAGFRLARGKWIAQLDDDDVWTDDHIDVLMEAAKRGNYEFVYGIVRKWLSPDEWRDRGDATFANGVCQPSGCFFRSYLRVFPADPNAWKTGVGADRQRAWRLHQAGVRGGFVDRVVATMLLRPGTTRSGHLAEDRGSHEASR